MAEAKPSDLRRIPAFGAVPEAALQQLIDNSASVNGEAGQNLMRQGDASTFALILLRGEVSIVAERSGGAFPVGAVAAPALIGEIGALADLPRTASVVARGDVVALSASAEALWTALQSAPGALSAVVRQLGGQIKGLNAALGLYAEGFRALERGELVDSLEQELAHVPPELLSFTDAFARLAERIKLERRTRADMASAALIQREMLPRDIAGGAVLDRCEVFGDMKPAKDVGGDLYDILPLDDHRLAVCIGDVCGKGVPASLFMCLTVATLRAMARDDAPVDTMMAKANALLTAQNPTSMFSTLFFAVLDTSSGELRYVNCGHNAPVLLRGDGGVERLTSGGPPLGIIPGKTWPLTQLRLVPGDAVFLFTDGVSEAANAEGDEYGEERLLDVLSQARGGQATAIVEAVMADVAAFEAGAERADDITCLALRLR